MKAAAIMITAFLFATVICCAAGPQRMNRLSIGMTKQQVIAALGAPSSTASPGKGVEFLRYKFPDPKKAFRARTYTEYFVLLKNDAVEQYGKMGDFDSTKDPTLNVNINKS